MSMSLPTPPRTTHKDKENLPPTPPTPSKPKSRTPRIAWSLENLHHAYTTQIRELPASNCTKEPAKSILKRPSMPLMPFPQPEQSTRQVTPEPVDPLQHPLFLNSPVTTLVTSLQAGNAARITLTDLTEAYSVLSARLKAKASAMLDMYGPIPALEPLRDHREVLVEIFHRDIGRAFINPQLSPPPLEDSPWSSPSSVGSVKKRGYTEQEVKYARDLCNLSHAAMRCFSNIAVIPVLFSIFSDTQLSEILTNILAIPLAPFLPTPNARKTYQIAVWTLQVQRLPAVVLAPAADRIAYALRRGIEGELGREGKKGAAWDALRAVTTLVAFQPSILLPPFVEILPSILSTLTSQNLTLRLQAAHALLSISHAYTSHRASLIALDVSLPQAITTYLMEQHQLRRNAQDVTPLGKAFRACLEVETPTHAAQSPMWALSIIAAFIALSGSNALACSRTTKFVLAHLQAAMAVKRTTVRATAGLVWRALVWACIRLDSGELDKVHKDAGWKVVCQILDGSIGLSIAATLVGQRARREERVTRGLEVVRSMIKKGGRTCEEAVDVLEKLLNGVGSGVVEQQDDGWVDEKLIVEALFDGTLLHAEWKGLVGHVKGALASCATAKDVRPLVEEEVIQHWDALFVLWREAVERAPLGENGEVPSALLNAWQALLLSQAQLLQGYEHLTTAPIFLSQLTGLLKSFLCDPSLEWSLDAGKPSWSSQPLKLGFVRNLWTVARNVFSASTLAGAAQTLLCEVLHHEYYLDQIEVRETWAALCAELVLGGMPELVRSLWLEQEKGLEESKKDLWRVVSRRWVEHAGSWDGAIELLRVPFAFPIVWEFDRDDFELWVRLVDCALLVSATHRISSVDVLDTIAREIGAGHNHTSLYAALPYLLSGIDASPPQRAFGPHHPSVLLSLTDDVLAASYPPLDAGAKSMLLAIVASLTEIVKIACRELLVELLARVQGGIRIWLQDEKDIFTTEEYNRQIIPFYVTSLEALKTVPPSLDMLRKFTPLFVSAFNRIPEPALGPSAFKNFWIETYKRFDLLDNEYPEDLKPILRGVQEAMCTSEEVLAPKLSPGIQTQYPDTPNLPLTIIPDSLEPCIASAEHTDAQPDPEGSIGGPGRSSDVARKVSGEMTRVRHHMSGLPNVMEPVATSSRLGASAIEGPITQRMPRVENPESSVTGTGGLGLVGNLYDRPALSTFSSEAQEAVLSSAAPSQDALPASSSSPVLPPVKEEEFDIGPNTDMVLGMSHGIPLSQQSRSSSSSLGKRHRSRVYGQSNKKRKTAPAVKIEVINISDDEDSEQVELDASIVVPTKRRKSLGTRSVADSSVASLHSPLTPKSTSQSSVVSSNCKKRTFFEAVELPRLRAKEKRKYVPFGSSPDASPCAKKNIIGARAASRIRVPKLKLGKNTDVNPAKRHHTSDLFKKGKGRVDRDWSDDSPRYTGSSRPFGIGGDDIDMQETPLRASDVSLPSSRPGKIPASRIISPALRRSRSEIRDPPSDDNSIPSSPLKRVSTWRARTVPALLTDTQGKPPSVQPRTNSTRKSSEGFLALEHARIVIFSDVSQMNVQELLEASRMVNQISGMLSDEITKKLGAR